MNTKSFLLAGLAAGLALQLTPAATAQTFSSGPLNESIPDGNLSGLVSQLDVNVPYGQLTDLTLTLDIAGDPTAYNGDFFAYLQFQNGLCVLLNSIDTPPTFGSPGNGINVTLADGNPNIGTAPYGIGVPLTGTFAPQGGGTTTGAGLDGSFGGLDPNGTWTIFVADTSAGGKGKLVNWSLTVNGVPDNVSTGLLLTMGVGALALLSVRQPKRVPAKRK